MLHEHLQADIIREDGLSTRITTHPCWATAIHIDVGSRRVQLGEQETCLGAPLVADYVSRDGEAVNEKVLRICLWRFEKGFNVFVALLIRISCLSPFSDGASMEDEDVEECVEEQDDVGLDGDTVKKHRLWRYF